MVVAFAPVNIAWVKYMGKDGGRPANASLSMTLASIGTTTSLNISNVPLVNGQLKFDWSSSPYIPPESGLKKATDFLSQFAIFESVLNRFGIEAVIPKFQVQILTENSAPAGTGIATSASGFAALTLAWLGILSGPRIGDWIRIYETSEDAKKAVAGIAGQGSGSACRSFMGPFVEWNPLTGVQAIASPQFKFVDFILLFDEKEKQVSSSEAHLRVMSSPHYAGRVDRAHHRLSLILGALEEQNLTTLSDLVLSEALDMHDLFHTSNPPFSYLNAESKSWIDRAKNRDADFPTKDLILTLDAGANVHLFVLEETTGVWETYLRKNSIKFICSKAGKGAHYGNSGF